MIAPASLALGVTLSLITVFGGIGVLANVLIFYAAAQAMAERRENRERKEREKG